MPNETLLTEKQVADLLGYSTKRLQAARVSGDLKIPFIALSKRAIRYRRGDVEAWIASHRSFTSTSEYPVAGGQTENNSGKPVVRR
jgi:predicted DNA-binding transcriptional regulator AlpA